jgi:hypothetical protein
VFLPLRTDVMLILSLEPPSVLVLFDKQRNLRHGDNNIDRPLFTSQDEWKHDPRDLSNFRYDGDPETHSPSTGTREFFLTLLDEATQNYETSGSNGQSKLFPVVIRAKLNFLWMVLRMWGNVLSRMSVTLDGIDRAVGDSTLISTSLPAWRKLLSSWRYLLVDYHSKIVETSRVLLLASAGEGCCQIDLLTDLKSGYAMLDHDRKRLGERVERTSQALMSTMSIIESKNAIVQTESIGKLTELAFVFVPLSFATSFFGMDIKVG